MNLRNVYDKAVPTRNLVGTITGIIMAVLSILVFTNVINFEQKTELEAHAVTIIEAVAAIIAAIQGIINIFFVKDGV